MEPKWSEIKSWEIDAEKAHELLKAYLADKIPKGERKMSTFKIAERLHAQLASNRQSSLRAISKHALNVYRTPHTSTQGRKKRKSLM